MTQTVARVVLLALTAAAVLFTVPAAAKAQSVAELGTPPPGFSSAHAQVNGTDLHYVRGGQGPVVILIHGFPEDWVEYRAIMPRLAQRFTVVAIDLPGIGRSAPANGSYDAAIWRLISTALRRPSSWSGRMSSATILVAS
jgi:alpha-beta hydrolase superfamily lysophospholipase